MTPEFDHVGIVVRDIESAVAWLCRALPLVVQLWESEVTVPAAAFAIPGETVRLRGALLTCTDHRGVRLELHEFLAPITHNSRKHASDIGLGHIAFRTADIRSEMARLSGLGVNWYQPAPLPITSGPYVGREWVYGWAPDISTVIELFSHPRDQYSPERGPDGSR